MTKTLQESEVTRHGQAGNPAYLIEQEDGARVLKLANEVE